MMSNERALQAMLTLELEKLEYAVEHVRNRFIAYHGVLVTDEVTEIKKLISDMKQKIWTGPHEVAHTEASKVLNG